jgi:hypothetical protein
MNSAILVNNYEVIFMELITAWSFIDASNTSFQIITLRSKGSISFS